MSKQDIQPGDALPADRNVSGPADVYIPAYMPGDIAHTTHVTWAPNLLAYSYLPKTTAGWSAGQQMTVGALAFHWTGSTWADGPA